MRIGASLRGNVSRIGRRHTSSNKCVRRIILYAEMHFPHLLGLRSSRSLKEGPVLRVRKNSIIMWSDSLGTARRRPQL